MTLEVKTKADVALRLNIYNYNLPKRGIKVPRLGSIIYVSQRGSYNAASTTQDTPEDN